MAAAGIEHDLSLELSRIVASPYPPSLANLADLLARADVLEVQKCLDLQPTAVLSLVSIVAAALSSRAHALCILQKLCHSPFFRDAFLLQNPGLLDALLTKANAQPNVDENAETCMLLLSRPLPDAVPLPASAQPFFLRAFERAVKSPDAATLRSLYLILNGACGLISLLDPKDRERLDRGLKQLLSSQEASRNAMLLLWCFAIIPYLDSAEEKWRTASGRKCFGSEDDMHKTIDFAALSVVYVLSENANVTGNLALESVAIAIRTILVAHVNTRQKWLTSSRLAKKVYQKLPEKLLQVTHSHALQLEGLCLHGLLVGPDNLSTEIIAKYESVLPLIGKSSMDAVLLREALSLSLPVFASKLSRATVTSVMKAILSCDGPSCPPSELTNNLVLVEELLRVATWCGQFRSHIVLAMCSHELGKCVDVFLKTTPGVNADGLRKHPRRTTTDAAHRTLLTSIVSFLLNITLLVSATDDRLPQTLVVSLIDKQKQLANQQFFSEPSPEIRSNSTVSLFEQECTPLSGYPQQDWKTRLQSDLDAQNSYQRDFMMRSVTQICHELETRCENVEEPLRNERQKVKELEQELGAIQDKVASFESGEIERQWYIDGLEQHNSDLDAERAKLCETLDAERTKFSESLNRTSAELATTKLQWDAALKDAQDAELRLRSTITSHEDSLRKRDNDLGNRENEADLLKGEIRKLQRENIDLEQKRGLLENTCHDLKRELEIERQTALDRTREIDDLTREKDDLDGRLRNTTNDLLETAHKQDTLQSRYQALVESTEDAMHKLDTKYNNDMEKATLKAKEEVDRLNKDLKIASEEQRESKAAHEETQQNLLEAYKTIDALEATVNKLMRTCEKKDQEIVANASLTNQMIHLLNVARQGSLPVRSGEVQGMPLEVPHAPGHRRRKSAVQMQDLTAKSTAMEDMANASFTSSDSTPSGPTPKRSKPRFKIPKMSTPYGDKAGQPPISLPKRSALKPISPNRRHTMAGFAGSEHEKDVEIDGRERRRGSLQSAEQASFDMDGMLAGTPFTPGRYFCGTGRQPANEETAEL